MCFIVDCKDSATALELDLFNEVSWPGPVPLFEVKNSGEEFIVVSPAMEGTIEVLKSELRGDAKKVRLLVKRVARRLVNKWTMRLAETFGEYDYSGIQAKMDSLPRWKA